MYLSLSETITHIVFLLLLHPTLIMIRLADFKDCENLALLAQTVWLETYATSVEPLVYQKFKHYCEMTFTPEYFENAIKAANLSILLYEKQFNDQATIAGFALIDLKSVFTAPKYGFEIKNLYVSHIFQGVGIGTALLNAIKETLGSPFWLYTWNKNASNEFYQRYGFKQVGTYDFDFFDEIIHNIVYAYQND